jgi:hypothetical protein
VTNLDYRSMLARYIHHVSEEEGVDFLDSRRGVCSDVQWTDEEWAEIQDLRTVEYHEDD